MPEQNASFGEEVIELVAVIVAGILLVMVIITAVVLVPCAVFVGRSQRAMISGKLILMYNESSNNLLVPCYMRKQWSLSIKSDHPWSIEM